MPYAMTGKRGLRRFQVPVAALAACALAAGCRDSTGPEESSLSFEELIRRAGAAEALRVEIELFPGTLVAREVEEPEDVFDRRRSRAGSRPWRRRRTGAP